MYIPSVNEILSKNALLKWEILCGHVALSEGSTVMNTIYYYAFYLGNNAAC